MPATIASLRAFIDFCAGLKGDEKGEAVLFVDRLMRALGHEGSVEAGGTHEWRVISDRPTKFADFVWPGRVLVEMKKRGENLAKHYQQAFEYWVDLVPNRPAYVLLSNFDEIWIYDLNRQVREPVQKIPVARLDELDQLKALRFLEPEARLPEFTGDRVKVTRKAADSLADVYNSLVGTHSSRPGGALDPKVAERYVLQCLVALFSEDAQLLPENLFEAVLKEAINQNNTYDVIGGLFRQMNDPSPASGGLYKGVGYFNGGLFAQVAPIDLNSGEYWALYNAAKDYDWSQVEPEIFGSIFQTSMGSKVRHAYGAHYTSPVDIMKVVTPTIVRPWRKRIDNAIDFAELRALKVELSKYAVLDPACGSGNFLYVAFRELKAIERQLIRRMLDASRGATLEALSDIPSLSTRQFYGMDVLPFAIELARVTLMLAKERAVMMPEGDDPEVFEMVRDVDHPLPLDNLDKNILLADAMFDEWPKVDAIIGNPPFQSKNKAAAELGIGAVEVIRERYPDIPGRADLCVYWFRIAHDMLPPGGRAGLVGMNTITQNYSREGGLDYIVGHGGTIIDAVSTQPWSGDAAVHVSIVNWVKEADGGVPAINAATWADLDAPKRLAKIEGDNPAGDESVTYVPVIGPSLSLGVEVSSAVSLRANEASGACYQGQTHGQKGFLLSRERPFTS